MVPLRRSLECDPGDLGIAQYSPSDSLCVPSKAIGRYGGPPPPPPPPGGFGGKGDPPLGESGGDGKSPPLPSPLEVPPEDLTRFKSLNKVVNQTGDVDVLANRSSNFYTTVCTRAVSSVGKSNNVWKTLESPGMAKYGEENKRGEVGWSSGVNSSRG
ncbi:hypothetical protein AXG93_4525s1010 [Marchantia polymorpha subsp. ruderalis]|uniref:Uncharacterized protein n=1 Tax=Marchantia polymorpha subsp. ruderalis TaxID=1480154 RepID=A0A176WG68_MARPO|nr:hypothetical protein AXG93_4525s1010 [Marchantia polymorpha subsp. ruderalis]